MVWRVRIIALGAVLALLLGPRAARARIWQINPDGSGEAPTIQAGMDSAQAGDEVLLARGTYTWTSQGASGENMLVMKRNVVLRSESGPAVTILDAENRGRVIQCVNVDEARIEGLMITRGYSLQPFMAGNGSGINSTGDSRPSIVNCIVTANRSFIAFGGGINCEDAAIINCEISNNEADSGGGLRMVRGSMSMCRVRGNAVTGDPGGSGGGVIATGAMISDCLFEENSAFGPFGSDGGGALIDGGMITRCTFVRNFAGSASGTGGAIRCFGSVTISECVFLANVAVGTRFPGVGGAISSASGSQVVISRCTLVGNRGVHTSPPHAVPPVGGVYFESGGGTVSTSIIAWSEGAGCAGSATFSCTDLYANSLGDAICGIDAGGNFNSDPLLCSTDPVVSRDVSIRANSACAPGNHPNGFACDLIGAAGVGCESVLVKPSTWSEVKSLYRR